MRKISHYLNVRNPLISPFISFLYFLPCYEKDHDNKEFSRGNSKPHCDSGLTTR